MAKEKLGTHNCPEGGIGCTREALPTLGAFVTSTGGTIEQRRYGRNYSKTVHDAPLSPDANTTEFNRRIITLSA